MTTQGAADPVEAVFHEEWGRRRSCAARNCDRLQAAQPGGRAFMGSRR
jgi:hypothetical protein